MAFTAAADAASPARSPRGVITTPVAVILVAGIGQRLRPLTDDRPKALIDVGG